MRRDPRGGSYMIGVVSSRYEIHPQTLRMYEREGLLTPSRTEGKTRLYSEDDLERLEFILSLTRDLGVNLAGVEVVMNLKDRLQRMHEEMQGIIDAYEQRLRNAGIDFEAPAPDPSHGAGLVKLTRKGLVKR